jgi:hypothetical protein
MGTSPPRDSLHTGFATAVCNLGLDSERYSCFSTGLCFTSFRIFSSKRAVVVGLKLVGGLLELVELGLGGVGHASHLLRAGLDEGRDAV